MRKARAIIPPLSVLIKEPDGLGEPKGRVCVLFRRRSRAVFSLNRFGFGARQCACKDGGDLLMPLRVGMDPVV